MFWKLWNAKFPDVSDESLCVSCCPQDVHKSTELEAVMQKQKLKADQELETKVLWWSSPHLWIQIGHKRSIADRWLLQVDCSCLKAVLKAVKSNCVKSRVSY